MRDYSVCVVGGGASGIMAAISSGRKRASAAICERMPRLGRKLLASGNGKCNFFNEHLTELNYNAPSRNLVKSIFGRFNKEAIKRLFGDLGLLYYSDPGGRVFPVTNQSSSVLRVLEMELERRSVRVELNFEVIDIAYSKNHFVLTSRSNRKISCVSVILTGGGKSYPALGSDGNAYRLAESFGHRLVGPVPVAVPITVNSPLCHLLQGQKIQAKIRTAIDGKVLNETSGDLLFTKYGLSGTAVLDASEEISIAVNRLKKKGVKVFVDMVPFIDEEALASDIAKRADRDLPYAGLIAGILPNKFSSALRCLLDTRDPRKIAAALKNMAFDVTGTRGWNEAEFTAGGIDISDLKENTLESKLIKGLYLAGEILDVNGRRGGYNLAWAWASGYVAGLLE